MIFVCRLEIKHTEKVFLSTINELMTEKEGLDYIVELERNIKNINPEKSAEILIWREFRLT